MAGSSLEVFLKNIGLEFIVY
eukprot:SAG31_NODE_10993_length_1075_cov_1.157787_1_plen_20_part_10